MVIATMMMMMILDDDDGILRGTEKTILKFSGINYCHEVIIRPK